MVERGRVLIASTVIVGHVLFVLLLARAMRPELPSAADVVMVVDFSLWTEPESEPEPEPEIEPAIDEPAPAAPSMPVRTVRPRERARTPMQAVIAEPAESEPAPAQWRLPPSADPFALPPAQVPPEQGFGRRDRPGLPSTSVPRIAGEAPPNPIIPEQRMVRVSVRDVVHAIGGLIGGGPNAPVEAPCGGRINGGGNVSQGFPPAWSKHYGCAENPDPAAFDGRFEQPPGTVR